MGMLEQAQVSDANWRQSVNARLDEHMERLDAGDERMSKLEYAIGTNTEITKRIDEGVAEMLEIFAAVRGFAKVGGWIGSAIKWVAAVVIALGVLYWFWKTGDLPRND